MIAVLREARWLTRRRVHAYARLMAGGVAAAALLLILRRQWPMSATGGWLAMDFVAFYATSVVLHDPALTAAQAYDPALLRAVQEQVLGAPPTGRFLLHNPPAFLFALWPMALVSYPVALGAWIIAQAAALWLAMGAIGAGAVARTAALAAPATALAFVPGQNGALSGALMALFLGWMRDRPAAAGIALGLLSYKPQFGLAAPLVLALLARWRVFAVAAATVSALTVASLLIFGSDAMAAFLDSTSGSASILARGGAGWSKLQSAFAFVFRVTGSRAAAWAIHGVVAVLPLALLRRLARAAAPEPLIAAASGVACVLATPYIYVYDLPTLLPVIALLGRDIAERGARPWDRAGLLAVFLLPSLYLIRPSPVGLVSALLLLGLVARRASLTPVQPGRPSRPPSDRERRC